MDYPTAIVLVGFIGILFYLQRRLFVGLNVKSVAELSWAIAKKDNRFIQLVIVLFYATMQTVMLAFILEGTVLRGHEFYAILSAIIICLFIVCFGLALAFRASKASPPPRWFYFVPYENDIDTALKSLRDREFKAGRYNPVIAFPSFPIFPSSPSPGAKHASIWEAQVASIGVGGTRSILDVEKVSYEPCLAAVSPLSNQDLVKLYGTYEPSREMIEQNMGFFGDLEADSGVYIIVSKDGKPSEILFAGYSSG